MTSEKSIFHAGVLEDGKFDAMDERNMGRSPVAPASEQITPSFLPSLNLACHPLCAKIQSSILYLTRATPLLSERLGFGKTKHTFFGTYHLDVRALHSSLPANYTLRSDDSRNLASTTANTVGPLSLSNSGELRKKELTKGHS
jgi:hypothetical protein